MLNLVGSLLFLFPSCQHTINLNIAPAPSAPSPLLIASHMTPNQTWAVGAASTVVCITQEGIRTIPGPQDSLQLRDVHAWGPDHALVLSIGPGADSKVLQWENGQWDLLYTLPDSSGFLDCMDFWDDKRGLIYGDSFDGWPYILKTDDGGHGWQRISKQALPPAGDGEGGFASSGTCLQTRPSGTAWIGTGAGGNARLLLTRDYGETWHAMSTPMVKGKAAGITSLDFVDDRHGVIVGGDLNQMDSYTANAFRTADGGKTWEALSQPLTVGPLYCVAYERINDSEVIIVCGPHGADASMDCGQTWLNLAQDDLWRCELDGNGEGWLMGRDGKMYQLQAN